jgi:hypothetical protein
MNRSLAITAAMVAAVASAALGAGSAQADPGAHDRASSTNTVARIRQAIEPYADVKAAVADGYVRVSDCESSEEGGMGYHYLNPEYVVIGDVLDPTKPTILLYGPGTSGGLRLLGAEYWQPAVGQPVPMLGDEPFNGPMPGHGGDMPVHYDLHVWTHVANPSGVFATWNPNVSC